MGQAVPVRTIRPARFAGLRSARRPQERRLLAIAAVIDGASREDAAKAGRHGPPDVITGRAGQARRRAQGDFSPPVPAVHGGLTMHLHEAFSSRCRMTRSIAP